MYTDAQLRPSQAQSLAGAAATTASTNAVDLLSANTNMGRGRVRRAIASAVAAFTGGTSVQVNLIQSANADLSSPDVLVTGPVIADAAATLGKVLLDVAVPDNTKRYVGFQYVTLGTHTTGQVTSHYVADTDRQPYLPSNTGF